MNFTVQFHIMWLVFVQDLNKILAKCIMFINRLFIPFWVYLWNLKYKFTVIFILNVINVVFVIAALLGSSFYLKPQQPCLCRLTTVAINLKSIKIAQHTEQL